MPMGQTPPNPWKLFLDFFDEVDLAMRTGDTERIRTLLDANRGSAEKARKVQAVLDAR
jgi:hypothetical protein